MHRIKIVLADDHQIVRECLRALLQAEPDIEVIGEVSKGREVADAVLRLDPDVLVLDLMMPDMNGLEVTRHVHLCAPDLPILILSMHSNEHYVREAFRNGASGYVLKDENVETLVMAIRTVWEGRRYLGPAFREKASSLVGIDLAGIEMVKDTIAEDPYDTVTQREREVLLLVAEGHTAAGIAVMLSISRKTVELHRARILEKLQLSSQSALVRYAIRKGLLSMDK